MMLSPQLGNDLSDDDDYLNSYISTQALRKEAAQHQEKLREGREATARAEAATHHITGLEGQVQGLQASRGTLHNLVSALKTSQDELRAAHGRLGQVPFNYSGIFFNSTSCRGSVT